MLKALVGYTGFVGSNLFASGQFDTVYNSKNIEEAYGTNPEFLIYAGLRAEKYLANSDPGKDMAQIIQAENNISRINPKKLVLISTIDVFQHPMGVDENTEININGLHAYGFNRYQLELWVRENYPNSLIIRLPGLYGRNLKKNFIYDYIHVIPFMLKKDKMDELLQKDPELKNYYTLEENGFFKVKNLSNQQRNILKSKYKTIEFSALNFTDSRSKFQFYNLKRLWSDIQTALELNIRLWHPATEPISAYELFEYLTGKEFVNELQGTPADYNYKTVYAKMFHGENGYISKKAEVLSDIKSFIELEK